MAKLIIYCLLWFAVCIIYKSANAQTLQTTGTTFVFSIPEDASHIIRDARAPATIELHILSPHTGTGILSADGTTLNFNFKTNTLCKITLPRTLVHSRASGNTRLGITLQTSAPVNVVLHDILEYAGEATQVWPVETLGNEYLVASWGLFNDRGEDNHAEVTITPVHDKTEVTIIPSVRTLGGVPKDSAFTVTLNRGDSYIVKADTSSASEAGLSGTRIRASAPVSVMTAVTCAYVPSGNQACNMLLDHMLPLEFAGTEFFASPLGDTLREAYLLITSSKQTFSVTVSDGRTIAGSNGRAVIPIEQPVRCQTNAPAFCHLLTPGVTRVLISDPSMVAILPSHLYFDTVSWYTPKFLNGGMPFYQTVNVISKNFSSARINGKPLTSAGSSAQISGTDHFVTQIVVTPGNYLLTSGEPFFAIVSGFFSADAYSFIPMGQHAPPVSSAEDLQVVVNLNPATKTIGLDVVGTESVVNVTIFNALGNVVHEVSGPISNLREIPVAHLPPGSYVVEVTSGTHRGKSRFVITE